jgi:hypothetical protein
MNRCAKAIILRADDESGIISQRQVGGILKSVDIRLDYDDYGGFFAFMDQDDRFHILEDGRVVLTDRFTGKIDDIKIAEHLPNLLECVTAALDKVVLNADDTFMIGTLLGALNADGHFIRSDQFRELYDCLKTIDRVERVGGNTYRIIDTTESGISGYAKLRRSHPIKERKSAAVTIQEQETQDTITKPKGPPTADELFSTNPDPYQKKTKRIKDPLENMIKSASNMNSGQQRHKYWQP